MLNQFRRCCCLLQTLSANGNPVVVRNFAKLPSTTLKPAAVTNVQRRGRGRRGHNNDDEVVDFSKIEDRELRDTMKNMDMDLEPSLAHIGDEYYRYQEEKSFFKKKFRREKLYRKHFKDMKPQEVSLLTYAEKENIRYLHESNPDHWTPQKLAESFPISAEGAQKLLKSGFRARRPEDVIQHDEKVKDRLERVKAGEIALTPELKRKMAIREKIQFKVGVLPESVKELAIPAKPKPLGEFAKLVASPERIRQNEEQIALAEKEEQEAARRSEQFVQQMKEREIYAGSRFTLAEFEEKIKLEAPKERSSSASTTVSAESDDHVPEVQYLLNMKAKKKVKPTEVSEMLKESEETAYIGHRVQKFKSKNIDEDDLVPVNVEGGVPYLYDSKSGYQKPYASTDPAEDRIEIPKGKRVPGMTYQVGDSFYDEDGEFLYRII